MVPETSLPVASSILRRRPPRPERGHRGRREPLQPRRNPQVARSVEDGETTSIVARGNTRILRRQFAQPVGERNHFRTAVAGRLSILQRDRKLEHQGCLSSATSQSARGSRPGTANHSSPAASSSSGLTRWTFEPARSETLRPGAHRRDESDARTGSNERPWRAPSSLPVHHGKSSTTSSNGRLLGESRSNARTASDTPAFPAAFRVRALAEHRGRCDTAGAKPRGRRSSDTRGRASEAGSPSNSAPMARTTELPPRAHVSPRLEQRRLATSASPDTSSEHRRQQTRHEAAGQRDVVVTATNSTHTHDHVAVLTKCRSPLAGELRLAVTDNQRIEEQYFAPPCRHGAEIDCSMKVAGAARSVSASTSRPVVTPLQLRHPTSHLTRAGPPIPAYICAVPFNPCRR